MADARIAGGFSAVDPRVNITHRGEFATRRGSGLRAGNEPGLGERAPTPSERVRVPAVEPRERDAVARRVDEPPVADVDAHVADLRGLRGGSGPAEEKYGARSERPPRA